jgi:nitrate reductase NapAB chaperone NapD
MVLKFEVAVDMSQLMLKQLNTLRSMEDVLRMMLVSQHLGNQGNDQPPAKQ